MDEKELEKGLRFNGSDMSYNLFLDDERKPSDVRWLILPKVEWVIARNYNEFTKILEEKGIPEIVSFDHDLADEHYNPETWRQQDPQYKEKTGYECAKFFKAYCEKLQQWPNEIFIHTMNPVGRENITNLFK